MSSSTPLTRLLDAIQEELAYHRRKRWWQFWKENDNER